MALIEVNTLGQAIKKYSLTYSLGVLTGLYIGYSVFQKNTSQDQEIHRPRITIPIEYKK